jgi:hypothetical protein
MKRVQLLSVVGDDFERALLEAARREPVPASSRLAVARRLELGLQTHGHAPVPAGRGLWSKLTVLVAIGGLGVGGALLGAGRTGDSPRVAPSAVVAVDAPLAVAMPVVATSPAEPPSTVKPSTVKPSAASELHAQIPDSAGAPRPRAAGERALRAHGTAPRAPARTANRAPDPPPLAVDDGSLLREVRVLDRVRVALRTHDGRGALALLGGYANEFPKGELAVEAQVLRVAALQQTGQHAVARSLALRTLAMPGSARYRAELERSLRGEER